MSKNIAILLPCHNEATTIESVIKTFRKVLPGAQIHVYDNASTDNTALLAHMTESIVGYEPKKGKGNVIRRMFADIDADIYVMCDGDATYDAASLPSMLQVMEDSEADMVIGTRVPNGTSRAFPLFHDLGNRVLSRLLSLLFMNRLKDVMSGYRLFSRRFVKSFPALSTGFEVETELTVHALEMRAKIVEVDTPYYARPEGSFSKLHTIRDGLRVLNTMISLFRTAKPLIFWSSWAFIFMTIVAVLDWPVFMEYFNTGLVPRFPTLILSASLMVIAFLCLFCGLILQGLSEIQRDVRRYAYLQTSRTGDGNNNLMEKFIGRKYS